MNIKVFYKIAENPKSAPTPALEISDTKKQLEALKIEIKSEQDTKKRFEIARKIARLERFDMLQDGNTQEKEAVEKILKGKNSESYLGSDLLSLKKRGIDIASLILVDEKSSEKEVKSLSIEKDQSYIVNFGDNKYLNAQIGAGDILPSDISKVRINGVEGIRKNTPRPGYYDEKGKYLPIFDGYRLEIVAKGTLTAEDIKLANEANEKRWKKLRIEDMNDSDGNPLTNLDEDIALKEEAIKEKNNATEKINRFTRGNNIKKASEFVLEKGSFREVANIIGLNVGDIDKILALMSAIGVQESSSNYGAQGLAIDNPKSEHYGTRAIGRYQIMPNNWRRWSMNHFGETLDPTDPKDQDKLAFAQIGTYYLRHSRIESNFEDIIGEISQDWYGRGKTNQGPKTEDYRSSVVAIYRKLNNPQA